MTDWYAIDQPKMIDWFIQKGKKNKKIPSYSSMTYTSFKMTDSAETSHEKYFSFAEIASGRHSSVKVTDDGLLYAVDLVMAVTGKDRDMAGNVIRRLPDQIFQSSKFVERRSPRGGHPTKLVNFHDAIELVMVLPGKRAKRVKAQFANIIHRYLAGDKTLISEINSNSESSSGIAELARESMGIPNENKATTGEKRRREEDGNALTDAQEPMYSINDVFYQQKEALELRYEREHERLENGGVDEEERLQEENRNLEEENEKDSEYVKQLELELKAKESEHLETEVAYKDSVEAVRILSGLYLQEGFSKPQYCQQDV
jgi:hypothetical protein